MKAISSTQGIVIGSLLVCSYLTAHGATRLAALSMLDVDAAAGPRDSARKPVGDGEGKPTPKEIAQGILKRNIFDSTLGPLWPPSAAEEAAAAAAAAAAGEGEDGEAGELDERVPKCEGSLRLIGTFYNAHSPQHSLASLQVGGEEIQLVRAGKELEDFRLDAIYPKGVYLTQLKDEALCALFLFQTEDDDQPRTVTKAEPKPKKTAASVRDKRRNAGLTEEEIKREVKHLGGDRYRVSRAFVDKLTANQAGLMGVARVRPVRQGGQPSGVRLTGFQSKNLLGHLGLRSGDVLRTINGFDMTSPDSALQAYVKLKQADRLTLSVVRRGKPVTIEYEIH